MNDLTARLRGLTPEQAALAERYLRKRAAPAADPPAPPPAARGLRFGLFFFSDDGTGRQGGTYQLLLDAARFADENGFDAVWTPERHFHPFGGLYPNPSVLAAAVAAVTRRVGIRAGSVVLPLQSPIRVAEEWAVVDQLSGGRVAVSFASGWHQDDFVLAPDGYSDRRERMWDGIETVRRLWRGEPVAFPGPTGRPVGTRTYPRPVQPELPVWVTAARDPDTWVRAGRRGLDVLTALLTQRPDELADRVRLYHAALRDHGHRVETARVAVMLHTFLGEDLGAAREATRGPMSRYLRTHLDLFEGLLRQQDMAVNPADFGEADREALVELAFDRYFHTAGLLGTVDTAAAMVDKLRDCGVTDVACLIDFGVPREQVLDGLRRIDQLRRRYNLFSSVPSFGQERMWLIDRLSPGNPAYNCTAVVRLDGPLVPAAVAASLAEVARRHEPLRTVFPAAVRGPAAVIRDHPDWAMEQVSLTGTTPADVEAELARHVDTLADHRFDLGRGPLVRAVLYRLANDRHVIALVMHHIVTDGWSMGVLVREMGVVYRAVVAGRPHDLPPLRTTYTQYAAEQRGRSFDAHRAYWMSVLGDRPEPPQLPTDRPRTARAAPARWHRFSLPAADAGRLRGVAHRENATLFMLLLAAVFVLLRRWTGQADLAVGTPIANRGRPEVAGLVGYLANTVVLRADLTADPTFAALLTRVRASCLEAYDHQDYPFERLVEDLQPRRDLTRTPLFQTLFMLQHPYPAANLHPRLSAWSENWPPRYAKFDLTVWFDDTPNDLPGVIEYNADLFEAATVERLAAALVTLLQGIATDPNRPVTSYPLVPAPEAADAVCRWTRGCHPVPVDRDLGGEFAAAVAADPDAVAVICGPTRWTYEDLHRRSNQVAHGLVAAGVRPGDRVAVRMRRSAELVAAVLGVLKAGAAYLPIDPAYPLDRQAWIEADGGAARTLTDADVFDHLPADDPPAGSPDRPAYVIYTSGSTGRPKGVVVTHRNVVRLVRGCRPLFRIDRGDVWSFFHSAAFDFSVWEVFGGLLTGGRVVVVPDDGRQSPEVLTDLLAREGVTVLSLTPSAFRQWSRVALRSDAPRLDRLRLVVFGGEALDTAVLGPWFDRYGDGRPELVNMYGITETTVHVTARRITQADIGPVSPIGRPLPDLRAYLLDAGRNPVPRGWVGELYVGGGGVAAGYLNRPDLTAERFVPDPLLGDAGGRVYRSGDFARETADGELEFVGRADDQVKVRGHRVELGEVEHALRAVPGVSDCVVSAVGTRQGDSRLIGYVILQPGAAPTEAEVRAFLRRTLPEYMLPAVIMPVPEWPLTPSGKLNRAALPRPGEGPVAGDSPCPPRTLWEEEMVAIWVRLLGRADFGVRDSFFDLGGHSLLATELVMDVQTRFGVELPLSAVFEHPTIEAMVGVLADDRAGRGVIPAAGDTN